MGPMTWIRARPRGIRKVDLKHVIRRKVPARSKAKLRATTEEHMAVIGREPERIKGYFRSPNVKYAA